MRNRSLFPSLFALTLLASVAMAQEPAPTRITLNVQNERLLVVLADIFTQARIRFRVDPDVSDAVDSSSVTVSLTTVPFLTALESILRSTQAGTPLAYRMERGRYVITRGQRIPRQRPVQSPPVDDGGLSERNVTISVGNKPLKEVLDLLFKAVGGAYVVSPSLKAADLERKIEKYEARDKPFLLALHEILKAAGDPPISYGMVQCKYAFTIRREGELPDLRKKQIGRIEFVKSTLPMAINLLMSQVGANYLLALPIGEVLFSLKAENISLEDAVTRILSSNPGFETITQHHDP